MVPGSLKMDPKNNAENCALVSTAGVSFGW